MPEESALPFEQEEWFTDLNKAHPVQAAILAEVLKRSWRLTKALVGLKGAELEAKLKSGAPEIAELTGYLIEPRIRSSIAGREEEATEETDRWITDYVNRGGKDVTTEAVRFRDAWLSNPRGRPTEKRILAVKACELRIANPARKWREIAQEVCDCGKSSHDAYCKESVRVAVETLKKMLKKYGIAVRGLPASQSELHSM